jgi:hypothetical protein
MTLDELVAHARTMRETDLPNGVGNTIGALTDQLLAMKEALIFTRRLIETEECEWKLGEAIDRIDALLSPNRSGGGDV